MALSRWLGLVRPFDSTGGESNRERSSRIERAAEIAARSAARCTLPFPVTAAAIATRANAAVIRAKAPPRANGSACPFSFLPAMACSLPGADARVAREIDQIRANLATEPFRRPARRPGQQPNQAEEAQCRIAALSPAGVTSLASSCLRSRRRR